MYDELVKRLRTMADWVGINFFEESENVRTNLSEAADAIEKLTAKVESLQFFADNISKLPDCNTCLKQKICVFVPKCGEYSRINCPVWLGQPPKEG